MPNFNLAIFTESSHLERVILTLHLHFLDELLVSRGALLGLELEALLRWLEDLNHRLLTLILHALERSLTRRLRDDATILHLEFLHGKTTSGHVSIAME